MRFEITKEFEESDPKLELPWADPENSGLCYIDLKTNPSKIILLDEVQRFPVLGSVLKTLNAPGSVFRTVKCDLWVTAQLTEEEKIEVGQGHKIGSYLDLVFDSPELIFDCKNYLQLGESLEPMLHDREASASLEYTVRRCLYHPYESHKCYQESRWGFYVTLFLHAYGITPEKATQTWNHAVQILACALDKISRTLVAQADPSI